MVEIIKQSDFAEIALIVQNAMPSGELGQTPARDAMRGTGSAQIGSVVVRTMLTALQRYLVGKPGVLPDASRNISGMALLAGVDVIGVRPRREQHLDYIEGDGVARIRARNLDVLVSLGSLNPRGGILSSARYGVWTCRFGNNTVNCGIPVGYWEVMESCPETVSAVHMLTEHDNSGFVFCRSYSSTNDRSLTDNESNVLWKTLHFIPRKLKELYEVGEEIFLARVKAENAHPHFDDRRQHSVPTNGELCALLGRKIVQKFRRKWDDVFFLKQWILLYDIRDEISTSLCRFKRITPPKDLFWADPFIVSRDNKYYIFIEEGLCPDGKGHISVIVMNKDGTWEPAVPVVEAPYHLSYPFVFEFENDSYMIPESYENHTVELYKCTEFPRKWEFQKTLMERCRAVDTTLLQWEGKWWMFSNRTETEGAPPTDELFLHYSDSPLSDNWIPHQRNPVVSDVRSARPAGRLFVRDGRLYRPSQNCSPHYGYGFNICEITKLTETDYEERVVSRVEPNWDRKIVSTHTLNYEDGLTVIDAELRERKG